MPFIILERGPTSKHLFYREYGNGMPLLFLHGGWGYGMYPFDAQIAAMQSRFRILIPDRTGYGRSGRIDSFLRGFHEAAAQEMRAVLDELDIEQCLLWGHSDGAVTAVRMGLAQPERFPAIVAEGIHYDRCKRSSRVFFETAASNPRKFGNGVAIAMAREHGDEYWEYLMKVHGRAWLDILDHCGDPAQDLYSGRIADLRCPTLLVHGSGDPRTEPDELRRLRNAAPGLMLHLISGGGHSPHNEPDHAVDVTRAAETFFLAHT